MKLKRSLTVLIIALFAFVVTFSFFGIFSVRKVEATFAVSENTNVEQLQEKFDSLLNKNLLFLNEQEIYDCLIDNQYMEVLSVEKAYPNVVKVSVKERREIYYLKCGDGYLVTTAEGFVLRIVNGEQALNGERDKIILNLDGISLLDWSVGKMVKTDKDDLLKIVFEMAKSVNLTDSIQEITVFTMGGESADVTFSIYTGVDIVVQKADDDGVNKAIEGFSAYDSHANDYEKMFKNILVNKTAEGKIQVTWSEQK